MLTTGSLFSGIGGLELGLEWAGFAAPTWQVERDPVARAVLQQHWPTTERFDDVRTVGRTVLAPVSLICGGFPCQDTSSAGKRAGLSGARSGLWSEFARIVGELRPWWVVVENPASGASRWVDAVRGDLAELGYASLPIVLAASDCGACHRRSRVFLIAANPAGFGCDAGAQELHVAQEQAMPKAASRLVAVADPDDDAGAVRPPARQGLPDVERHRWWAAEPNVARVVHGLPGRVDRERLLGNACTPQQAQVAGEVIQLVLGADLEGPGGTTTHTVGPYGPITDRSESQ